MRRDAERRRRARAALSYAGPILMLCGLVMLVPLALLAVCAEERRWAPAFVYPAALLIGTGWAVWRAFRVRPPPPLTLKDGALTVVFAWVLVTLASSFPFLLILKLGFTQAVFESVSGWTTTGLSVVDVANVPRVILLWRSTMQLAGGAGVAVIFIAALGGPLGAGLALAEGRSDQLVPHVRHSMKLVVRIYAGYTVAGLLALRAAGMSWFDAVNHCFAAVSTGGFSTYGESIGHWDSPAIESVTLVLMLLGSTNFQTVYFFLSGRGRAVLRNGEVRTAAVLISGMVPMLYILCCRPHFGSALKSVRVAVFEIVTAVTTTGFSTTGYAGWAPIGLFFLIPLMIIGGGSGSTAGGIKQFRTYVLVKSFFWELRRMGLPPSAVVERPVGSSEGTEFLRDERLVQVASFVTAYLGVYLLGTAVLVASGFGITESLFEYASALGTVGLSVGVTGASAPTRVLWAEIVGMFLGRLEVFVVLLALKQSCELRFAR